MSGKFYTLLKESSPYLEDAEINYDADNFGGQLTIKAPSSRIPKVGEDATIEDRVNYIIYSEINPQLASHGGGALNEATEDNYVVSIRWWLSRVRNG